MYYTKSWNCVIFIKCMFFGMFSIFYNLKVIGSIDMWWIRIISLAIYKFDWSWVSILCKKRNSIFTSVYKLKLFVDSVINKESILNLVNRFFIFFIECWCNCIIISIIWKFTLAFLSFQGHLLIDEIIRSLGYSSFQPF